MSQYYQVGRVTLWNPSSGASSLFLRQVALYEQETGLPSGIGTMESDEAEVSPALLGPFVTALLAWRARTGHAVVQALSDGFIAVCLVLSDRAGVQVHWPESRAEEMNQAHAWESTSPGASADEWQTRVHDQAGTPAGLRPR